MPLVTLSLTVDEDGFPKQSKIREGNVSEGKTLKYILDGLGKEGGTLFPHEKTIVIEAGIATEDNLALIKQHLIYKELKIKLTSLTRIIEKTSIKPQRCSVETLGQNQTKH